MRKFLTAALALALLPAPAGARSLEQIKSSGTLSACLPANAMPFSHRDGEPRGFQVDVANALARELGVSLEAEWVISPIQALRANCDLRLDVIADAEAQHASHLTISKPYYRSGVALVSRPERSLKSVAELGADTKVAVMVGSITSMILSQRGVKLTTYAFEDEMLQAVAEGEADAAMVTPASAGYFNLTHPDKALVSVLPPDAQEGMAWNIGVGLRRPDDPFRAAIDATIDKLMADGTMASIYGKYGLTLTPPQ
jgi:polar amino acid transport system substrate-binding protein